MWTIAGDPSADAGADVVPGEMVDQTANESHDAGFAGGYEPPDAVTIKANILSIDLGALVACIGRWADLGGPLIHIDREWFDGVEWRTDESISREDSDGVSLVNSPSSMVLLAATWVWDYLPRQPGIFIDTYMNVYGVAEAEEALMPGGTIEGSLGLEDVSSESVGVEPGQDLDAAIIELVTKTLQGIDGLVLGNIEVELDRN